MEDDKNVGHEEIKEEGTKRAIEEVDGDSENIDERNKKLKSENTKKTDHDEAEPMTCDLAKKDDEKEKCDEKKVEEEEDAGQKKVKPKINYSKKKKCVLLLSYSGSGYNGMQRNPGVRTIEEDLTNALFKARAISEDAARNYGKMFFQRCARTDKGVSAARQVVSLKMVPYKELLPDINKHLEPQIRVFALKRVTRGFDCKTRCTSRTYEYLLPTFAFAPTYAHTARNFRITNEIIDELNLVLKKYEGTKNYHNFTSGKDFKEESAKRYIIRFQVAGEPFLEGDMEFLVLQVQGQSFMLHQIRKMIGLVIAIMKKYTGLDAISRAFQQPKMDIPRAPGLGLVLDQVHFRSYNERFGRDGFHEPLEWSECEDQIKEFKKQFIYDQIISTEASTNSMMRWLTNLPTHTYSNERMMELQKNRDVDGIAENSAETKETEEKKTEEISSNNSPVVPSEATSEKDSGMEPPNKENVSNCIVESSAESESVPNCTLEASTETVSSCSTKTLTETGVHQEETDPGISINHNTTVSSELVDLSNEEREVV